MKMLEKLNQLSEKPTSLGQAITGEAEQWLAESRAHTAHLREEYRGRYGLNQLSNSEVRDIERAERQLAECRNCNGQSCCRTSGNKYWQPVIRAIDGSLDVAQSRCKVGRQKDFIRKFREMKIPALYEDKTFEDYEETRDNREGVAMALWYVTEKPSANLYLYGGCGTGKTFLASLIAKEFIKDSQTVIFGDVPQLLDEIKASFDTRARRSSQDVLQYYNECDMLIMDDLGAGYMTGWSVGILYQIINGRLNAGKRLIVTSNFALNDLYQRLSSCRDGDAYSAKRICSRLSTFERAYFGNRDRRQG